MDSYTEELNLVGMDPRLHLVAPMKIRRDEARFDSDLMMKIVAKDGESGHWMKNP